ncbi:hypothetical protein N5P37_005863 [Trichoderma harzianum]|uniref:Uncharacterized protein n=1 Tax=Trichoderma harzianum CBS 226.95 TaxID=983964 RepID=A0A2T4AB69_TRIHA|nr:hypothetical protein M431DRAFT_496268 [Trichoderma harzianum CBS 226.95]KAK0760922.1 hypothetical protein N5P37_005863 [Trichoderma harzianum]PTB54329.1 hypothetical protein M431DRAFT_496268 [Trichoderma harzianum CBS 226.95]
MKTFMQTTAVTLLQAGLCMGLLGVPIDYPEGCPIATIPATCPLIDLKHCGPHPNCELLKIVTKPCDCPAATPTVLAPCPTCQRGCGTIYRTVTAECTQTAA